MGSEGCGVSLMSNVLSVDHRVLEIMQLPLDMKDVQTKLNTKIVV